MYKSRLQEYCQSKLWKLPEYSTTREGLDHSPFFKATVIVNGFTFSTTHFVKSSKEAQNLVAQIAFHHFTGSSNTSTDLKVLPTVTDAQQPKTLEPLQADPSNGVNSPNRNDKKFQDMAHLYKNQLQIYAQKRNLNLPVYISEREGPPHACHFKSKVILEGKTYESSEHFSTIKDAENAAAKAALMSVSSSDGTEEEDPGFFKNLLQELAQKDYSCLPAYTTTRSGPSHNPIFVSIVEISGESFTGQEAKTKKSSEMNAAKVAYIALRERKCKQNAEPDSSGYHVNDAPHCSFPKQQLIPVAELPNRHNFLPTSASERDFTERVTCKGAYHQDTEAEHTEVKPEALPIKGDSTYSSFDPFQPPSKSGVNDISQPSASSNASSPHKKIKVYPWTSNMTLPAGATTLHNDENWVAVTMYEQ
ncbi:double-stranded RNA-binding protein 1 isoform X2 [Beta vulgaris subsp. vulgaris]|uniref:double-stranded RNA-binding protein 1 isoform X2 n=1 Tax=Beta vulgaris subsp. vulgaris TaxID=3555 RepID=UPI0020368718|nr:double-stranded RNA-binding protein 1 isoform X2 [Beta vulgaris subsp. vulgaris]